MRTDARPVALISKLLQGLRTDCCLPPHSSRKATRIITVTKVKVLLSLQPLSRAAVPLAALAPTGVGRTPPEVQIAVAEMAEAVVTDQKRS